MMGWEWISRLVLTTLLSPPASQRTPWLPPGRRSQSSPGLVIRRQAEGFSVANLQQLTFLLGQSPEDLGSCHHHSLLLR